MTRAQLTSPHTQYKPRYGYKSTKDDQKDWLIEVGANDDPYEDQFAKRRNAKKARVLKNESQQVANLERQVGLGLVVCGEGRGGGGSASFLSTVLLCSALLRDTVCRALLFSALLCDAIGTRFALKILRL